MDLQGLLDVALYPTERMGLLRHIARFRADSPLEFRLQPVFWPRGGHAMHGL